MKHAEQGIAGGVARSLTCAALFLTMQPGFAGPKQTQQEATAASLATGALIYNYARRQNSQNGAYALAAGAGTAYLWNKYSHQRQAEKRQEIARMNYYRRRASYYHHLASAAHRTSGSTRRAYSHRRYS